MAARTGQSVAAVLEAPYGLTLWTYVQLRDADRIASVLAMKARFDLARYIAHAMWEPSKLTRLEREELRVIAGVPDELATKEAELIAAARALREARRQRRTETADGTA